MRSYSFLSYVDEDQHRREHLLRVRQIMRPLLVLTVGACLSACGILAGENGYFRDRSMDYKTAVDSPVYSLGEFAQPAVKEKIRPVMPIPPHTQTALQFVPENSGVAPRPQVIELVAAQGRVQIIRSSDQRWAWVEAESDSVYLWVSQFLANNQFKPTSGSIVGQVLRTQWVDESTLDSTQGSKGFWSRSVSAIKDRGQSTYIRYVVKLIPTQERGILGTQVLVKRFSHTGQQKPQLSLEDDTVSAVSPELDWWRSAASEIGEEITLLVEETSKSELKEGFLATLRLDGNGLPMLSLDRSFAPSWEVVGQALKGLSAESKGRWDVIDLDRSLGVYYLTWVPEEDAEQLANYQLNIAAGEQGVLVTVQIDDDTVAPAQRSRAILTELKGMLEKIAQG